MPKKHVAGRGSNQYGSKPGAPTPPRGQIEGVHPDEVAWAFHPDAQAWRDAGVTDQRTARRWETGGGEFGLGLARSWQRMSQPQDHEDVLATCAGNPDLAPVYALRVDEGGRRVFRVFDRLETAQASLAEYAVNYIRDPNNDLAAVDPHPEDKEPFAPLYAVLLFEDLRTLTFQFYADAHPANQVGDTEPVVVIADGFGAEAYAAWITDRDHAQSLVDEHERNGRATTTLTEYPAQWDQSAKPDDGTATE